MSVPVCVPVPRTACHTVARQDVVDDDDDADDDVHCDIDDYGDIGLFSNHWLSLPYYCQAIIMRMIYHCI